MSLCGQFHKIFFSPNANSETIMCAIPDLLHLGPLQDFVYLVTAYFNACAKRWGIFLHEDPRKMYFQELWSTFMKHALLLQGPLFTAGIILCMGIANGRWCYIVTSSLIGCAHTQIDHSVNGHSQWEMMLHCNIVSHWLCPYTDWSLW